MKKTITIILCIAAVAISAICIWLYADYKSDCYTNLPANTVINNIDCSGLTIKETVNNLTEQWNKKEFTFSENGKVKTTFSKLNLTYDIKDKIESIFKKSYSIPLITKIFKLNDDLKIEMTPSKISSSLSNQVSNLYIFENEYYVETKNAYVDMSNTQFNIVPEVYGTNIDKSLLEETILKKISIGKWNLDYREKDFYVTPTVKKDNQELLDKQAYGKKYLSNVITYEFGNKTYVVTPAQLDKMMTADENGNIKVDKKQVSKFVNRLKSAYDTVGKSRSFKSTLRGVVQLEGGTYGYIIDKSQEVAQLMKDIKAFKDVSRAPLYSQEGQGWCDYSDIGSTYVEVDLYNQRAFYYENGQKVIDTPIVSGCVTTSHYTVRGAYYIVYKGRDVELKGTEDDGTKYVSKVAYWMPFYSDYGLHDANWRGDFGGKIYITEGSHGCVNMPVYAAKQLFFMTYAGCPVYVI